MQKEFFSDILWQFKRRYKTPEKIANKAVKDACEKKRNK